LALAAEEKKAELARQETVKKLLAMKPARRARKPTFSGRLLSDVLRNTGVDGSDRLTLEELLTLRPVLSGRGPEEVTFELPIRYEAVTNLGELVLLVDTRPGREALDEWGQGQECVRATNGNCLLLWNSLYDPPGQHALLAAFRYTDQDDSYREVTGTVTRFFTSNLFQLDPDDTYLSAQASDVHAKLVESNATYSIQLRSPAGKALDTYHGVTSNGVIRVSWNLDQDPRRPPAGALGDAVFQVTLTDSGRSQAIVIRPELHAGDCPERD
jgi:hypothetical protein